MNFILGIINEQAQNNFIPLESPTRQICIYIHIYEQNYYQNFVAIRRMHCFSVDTL